MHINIECRILIGISTRVLENPFSQLIHQLNELAIIKSIKAHLIFDFIAV